MTVGRPAKDPLHQHERKEGRHGAVEHVIADVEFTVDPLAGSPNRQQQHGRGFQGKNGPGLDRSKGQRSQQQNGTGAGQQGVSGKSRLRAFSDRRGFGLRCQGGTHGLSLDCFAELSRESSWESSGEFSGESSKSPSQSLPRIGEPAGKRSIASTNSVVESGVVTFE